MNELPLELKVKILKTIPINQRTRLRSLNREWLSIIDNFFKIDNLAISDYRMNVYNYFNTQTLIDCCFVRKYRILALNLNQPYFNNVKRLVFNGHLDFEGVSVLKQLDYLENLEVLELCGLKIDDEDKILINNEKLKYLKIVVMSLNPLSYQVKVLILNTPNLTHLKTDLLPEEFTKIALIYPQRIEYLESQRYLNQILEFKNLRYFYCEDLCDLNDDKFLKKLPLLEELHIFNQEEKLDELLQQKILFKKDKLKIFYQYVQLNSLSELDLLIADLNKGYEDMFDYFIDIYCLQDEIKFLANYQSRLADKLLYYSIVFYKYLEDYYRKDDKSFYQLVRKFVNLNELAVRGEVKDVNKLIMILDECKSTRQFELNGSRLPQEFFNDIPNLVVKLEFLCISNHHTKLDLEFLFNFRNLIKFKFQHQKVPISFLKRLFKKTNLFEVFSEISGCDDEQVRITHANNMFYLNHEEEHERAFKNLDDLYNNLDNKV